MRFFDLYNYWIFIVLMMIGFYTVIAKPNLVKKVIGLIVPFATIYSNPLPHALILTAIVVSVSTLAVALAIIVNIKQTYGTIEEDEIEEAEGVDGE